MDCTTNKILESAPEVVKVPYVGQASRTPTQSEHFYHKLEDISTPSQRLAYLFYSFIDIRAIPTQEAQTIRHLSYLGAGAGLIWGGIFMSPGAHQEYIRKHNASVFQGNFRANRHFWDTLVVNVVRRGFKWAVRASALTTSAGFIAFGSIAYRDRLYMPDWLLGFAFLGALSRTWLGPKAMAAGACLGLAGGSAAFALVRLSELATGLSVTEQRRMRQDDWFRSRQHRRLFHQQTGQDYFNEQIAGMDHTGRS